MTSASAPLVALSEFSISAVSSMNSLRPEAVVLLVLVLVCVSLFTRAWGVILAVVSLAMFLVLAWATPMLADLRWGILLQTCAFMFFFLGWGFSERRDRVRIREIGERMTDMSGRIDSFCNALDARSQSLDRDAIEIAKRRIQSEMDNSA
jgi:peptidoglycan/LPS O-acetylase OafA/YrhL